MSVYPCETFFQSSPSIGVRADSANHEPRRSCRKSEKQPPQGGPNFHTPHEENLIDEHVDRSHGMLRTEVTCHDCGAHLGHLLPDGPAPSGRRNCIDSASLKLDRGKAL